MAILKDLIVHGSSRFLNKIYANELEVSAFEAESAIIKKLTAKDSILGNATVVGLLDVQGQLHTNTWTNSNIATIDGCFYITPTLSSDSGNIVFSSVNVASLTGDFTAVNSLYIGDSSSGSTVQWTSGSKILLTGEVEVNGQWLPLGTLLGTLSANATINSIGLKELKDNRHNDSSIIIDIRNAVSNTSLNYRNLKISLYQRKDGNDSKPLGIYMTAMGTNGKTFIDIYGGVNATTTAGSSGGFADPNLRIGNLSGIPAFTTSAGTTVQPIGWGIYTTNGYFKGAVISDTGSIGGWNLTANSIWSGNSAFGNANGMYFGSSGISLGSTFKVTNTGVLTATSGSIGGWSIGTDTNKSLYYGNQTPGAITTNLILSPTSATNSNAIGGSETGLTWFLSAGKVFGVTTAGALYSTSGKIGGWSIGTSGIFNGITGVTTTGSTAGTFIGTEGISNYKDTSTYVNIQNGVITAKGVNLTGQITATSGTIAGWTIKQNYLITGDNSGPGANILMLNGNGTTSSYTVAGQAKTGWMITAGTTFGVNKDGGIYATTGKIGGFDIGTSSIKNTKTSYSETTNNGVWVGTDGIGLGKGLFYVTNAGALTAKSGSIAGWSFNASSLYKTNATPGYSAATLVLSTGTASTKNIGGGGTASKTWMISAGTGFGVTTAGTLYCNDAHISGEITATSGTIGGASITDGTLYVTNSNISGKISVNHIDVDSLSIGISQVEDLQTTLNGKQPSGDYATNTALTSATGWDVIINISAINYTANTATLHATVYKDGAVKTNGFTLQWYKTVTGTSTTTTAISGATSSTLSVTNTMGLDAAYTCIVS